MEWYLENVGLGKVWPDLKILEVFLMGVEVSFLDNFFFAKGFQGLGFVVFFKIYLFSFA